MMGFNIYSEKTKNGTFLKLNQSEYIAEYKIFRDKDKVKTHTN